ncbi:TetR/AcrR family transcriptional regulator [Paenibacillus sp. GCM10027626]|uniref:TetR/AcrR family transcriptional regulator n=1 Tax=Paenibacillus sp. GCM10027626 TaxID=3273411 RepID=UPI00363084BA
MVQSKGTLKERQRQEREQYILQAAEQIMLEKGYHHTSMDEIAEQVGIAKGTLYLHFARKEELAYALVEPKLNMFLESVQHAQTYNGTAQEKLIYLLEKEMSGAFFQFMLRSDPDLTSVFKAQQQQIDVLIGQVFAGIGKILDEGKEAGIFDRDLPNEMMAFQFINMFDPHLYLKMVEQQQMSKETFIRHIAKVYLRGIEQ